MGNVEFERYKADRLSEVGDFSWVTCFDESELSGEPLLRLLKSDDLWVIIQHAFEAGQKLGKERSDDG